MSNGPALVLACLMMAVGAAACAGAAFDCRVIDAGFWFEPVTYQSASLGGAVTSEDVAAIAAVARSELTDAFAGLSLRLSDRRDATYRVHVVQ